MVEHIDDYDIKTKPPRPIDGWQNAASVTDGLLIETGRDSLIIVGHVKSGFRKVFICRLQNKRRHE